ncbi:MAG TPA: carboxypeptidase regulatory-like domain-containing protein [bacterium]|nr:carboxypeptidase regulatory-like domain-containing protein [bacterium]
MLKAGAGIRAAMILCACFFAGSAAPVLITRVQDGETRQPLAGAMVMSAGSDIMAVTDSAGQCMVVSLPRKGGMLVASRSGYSDLRFPWSPPARPGPDTLTVALTLYTSGPRVVVGRVSDAATKLAIAGALVSVAGARLAESTRADGGFLLSGFPPGPQTLEASCLGYPAKSVAVQVRSGETDTVELYLMDTTNVGRAEGTVFDAGTGRPVAGARISVEGTGCEAVTDSIGHYSIGDVPVGMNKVLVNCEGYLKAYTIVRLVKDWAVTVDLQLRQSPSQAGPGR